jgi:dTDP-D-glucose 4,6-dehydratase
MKRVLITGASGFIGSGVLKYLLEHTDWEFTAVCSWRHKGDPLNVPKDPRVRVVTHDLCGPLPKIGYHHYILHLASESHVDRSIQEPVAFIENNVSSTLQVLEFACKFMPEVFVMFSSDEVFGAKEHAEWDVLLPSNPYSASKAAQEMIAIAYWSTYSVPVVITNSNNIVGPNQNPEKYLPKVVHLIENNDEVVVHTLNGEPGRRFYNPVQNVADALMYILKNYAALRYVGYDDRPLRFNIPGGDELNNWELAQEVADIMQRPLHSRLVDVRGIRPGYDEFYAKTDGRLRQCGWEPVVSLRDALPEIIDSYLEHNE